MYRELVAENGVVSVNAPVNISTEIQRAQGGIGQTSVYRDSLTTVYRYASENGKLKKSELRAIWSDEQILFASKCLVTLWWGHPSHLVSHMLYSVENLEILSRPEVEASFHELVSLTDFQQFLSGLKDLYKKFESGGAYHLAGVNTAFFSKLFHFYFATHPIASNPDFLPVIADSVMIKAMYAEMVDRQMQDRRELFNVALNRPTPIALRTNRGSSADSYLKFISHFNAFAKDLSANNEEMAGLTPFILEDILFKSSKDLSDLYLRADNGGLFLPDWMAGRFNAKEQMAIVFNNLYGETYLFEDATAKLWNELLRYDYYEGISIDSLCVVLDCDCFSLLSFLADLVSRNILVTHQPTEQELAKIKRSVNQTKQAILKSAKGVTNFHASYESVDNEYTNRILDQGIPFAISIELTYACNEACIHCYNPNSPREGGFEAHKQQPKGELETKEYFKLLDGLYNMGVAKITFTGGDPFMKKDLLQILQYAHKLKFAFSVYTNGQALYSNPELYSKVIQLYPQYIGLSLYSTIPEVHDAITRRKGSCEKTMAIARKCYKDAIGLQIKCPIMKNNVDSYDQVFDFALRLNGTPQFDVNITSSVDGDCFAANKLRLNKEQLEVVLKDARIPLSIENGVGVIERKAEMCFCGAGSSTFNVKPDGGISPCCSFPEVCGNVKEESIETIWRESSEFQKLRNLRYGDSDLCGKEEYCKYCNRCIGQSFVEHGIPENHSQDNCFIAKIRYELAKK